MSGKARQVDYFHLSVPNKPGEASRVLEQLAAAGIDLLGFSGFPRGNRRSQLDFIVTDSSALKRVARSMGLDLGPRKRAFVVQGADQPGAIAGILKVLAQKNINVTSIQAVSSGSGSYGAMLWVDEPDMRKAAKALSTLQEAAPPAEEDIVDIASEQSFPASDPPAWT